MQMVNKHPLAIAQLRGDREHMGLRGAVRFYQLPGGILVETDVVGLKGNGFFDIRICEGTDPLRLNLPEGFCECRPGAGELPPILSCNGKSYSIVMTDRFSIREILGRRVEICEIAGQRPYERPEKSIAWGAVEKSSPGRR